MARRAATTAAATLEVYGPRRSASTRSVRLYPGVGDGREADLVQNHQAFETAALHEAPPGELSHRRGTRLPGGSREVCQVDLRERKIELDPGWADASKIGGQVEQAPGDPRLDPEATQFLETLLHPRDPPAEHDGDLRIQLGIALSMPRERLRGEQQDVGIDERLGAAFCRTLAEEGAGREYVARISVSTKVLRTVKL